MKAADVMTRDVSCCRTDASLADAAKLMWDGDCGSVPVTDEKGRLQGIVTDRDVCMAALTQGRPLAELRLSSLVNGAVESCREDSDLDAVTATMARRQIRRLPVVDQGNRVVGIVSLNDLALNAVGNDGRLKQVATTLAQIGRHRDLPRAKAQPR